MTRNGRNHLPVSDNISNDLESEWIWGRVRTTVNDTKLQSAASNDETEILRLIEQWAKAVREENRTAIRANHDPGILMFDVPPPFLSRGLDDYMATWEKFFSSSERPVAFTLHDVQVTCGQDVAFATAMGRCVDIDANGSREPLEFRLTVGLRKLDDRWRVVHEHHSLPAT
jgi:ketosteroid isomerase-like protein